MNADAQYYLDTLGITTWLPQQDASPELSPWAELSAQVQACTRCPLSHTRTQTVFGRGNETADLMIIGEAPGSEEDKHGKPFVGRSGALLDAMLRSIGMNEEQVYIANILKCQPPENRDPLANEVEQCAAYLTQQIELVKPKLILALGRLAAHFLLNTTASLSQLRGSAHVYQPKDIPSIVTYHPAYLLRNPRAKKEAYHDLCQVRALLSS